MRNNFFASLALAGICTAILATALTSQYVFGLAPCPLCLYQRWPYVIVIVLSLLSAVLSQHKKPVFVLWLLCSLCLFIGTAIAFFHVGVEQHWWAFECNSTITATTLEDLKKQLLQTNPVRCDTPAWSLFGISMAGFNVFVSLFLGIGNLFFKPKIYRYNP